MVPTKYWNMFSKNKIYITEDFYDESISLQFKKDIKIRLKIKKFKRWVFMMKSFLFPNKDNSEKMCDNEWIWTHITGKSTQQTWPSLGLETKYDCIKSWFESKR